jgi:methylated-DNA-[protein]-cysteine S-methyltransferase
MIRGLSYVVFHTAAGWMAIFGSAAGVQRIILPRKSTAEVQQQLGDIAGQAVQSSQPYEDLITRFKDYFNGNRVDFPDRLDFTGATPFQREVWQAARDIPCGETRSYAWLAERIGRPEAARAVGQALGRNPLPVVIPCHRVIAGNGGLGGFSGGLEMKKLLLGLEAKASVR